MITTIACSWLIGYSINPLEELKLSNNYFGLSTLIKNFKLLILLEEEL